jgi:hypothetical protein
MVTRLIDEELRLLVIAWLVLTVPVVCHHETAVTIIGSVTPGHAHRATATGDDGHSHNHASVHHDLAQPAAPDSLLIASDSTSSTSRSIHTHGLPEGQDGLALSVTLEPSHTTGSVWRTMTARRDPVHPLAISPPAPPPRTSL